MICASPVLLNLTVIKYRLGLIKWLLWPSFAQPVLFVLSFVDWNVFYCCVLTAQTWLDLTWLRLLTLALSIGHCQCSYIFVSCWPSACNLQMTWIKKYRSQQQLSRIRSLALYSAHLLEPELPSAIKYFLNFIHIRLNVFLKQWVCIEHWIWIPIQWTIPIWE